MKKKQKIMWVYICDDFYEGWCPVLPEEMREALTSLDVKVK